MPQTTEIHPTIDLGVLAAEPADEYHARAGEYLTSSMLRDFAVSPDYFHRRELGEIGPPESPEILLGTAAHVRILEGKAVYKQQFAFGGPINPTTGKPYGEKTQAWARWAAEQGKPILSEKMAAQVEAMARSVSLNEEAFNLLLWGRAEGVVRAEYCGVPCQIRIDWLHPEHGIVDLKTTGRPVGSVRHLIRDRRFLEQLAFYQAVLAEVIEQYVPVYLILVEANEPHRCRAVGFTVETLERFRRRNEASIERLLECRRTGCWPSTHEPLVILDFP